MRIFVTVGMQRWPFDRLMYAVRPLCQDHEVFVQSGTSSVELPCPSEPFVGFEETQRRLAEADVVVTHAGNTVRLVQRLGKLPVAIAREQARGEMANDHQVVYASAENSAGRILAVDGDHPDLVRALEQHAAAQTRFVADGAVPAIADGRSVAELLDLVRQTVAPGAGGPFRDHPLRRYAWAFSVLEQRQGRHADVGSGDGSFLAALAARTNLDCVGVEPHPGYRAATSPTLTVLPAQPDGRLPFDDEYLDSLSMLDVLEHVADERVSLKEARRVLRPAGLLVLTVPARHPFSWLDPDNLKFRLPRVHRWVYSRRFGAATYCERFIDDSDGLRGDQAWNRDWHTNYPAEDLLSLLRECGLTPVWRDGANLFWRWLHAPQLLAPDPIASWLDGPIAWDGTTFHIANLHILARRDEVRTQT